MPDLPVIDGAPDASGGSPLSVAVLKRDYLNDHAGTLDDDRLFLALAGALRLARRYTRSDLTIELADPQGEGADVVDAIYTDAARRFRERDAGYGDAVEQGFAQGEGAIVHYLRQLPPRVKATYDLVLAGSGLDQISGGVL